MLYCTEYKNYVIRIVPYDNFYQNSKRGVCGKKGTVRGTTIFTSTGYDQNGVLTKVKSKVCMSVSGTGSNSS